MESVVYKGEKMSLQDQFKKIVRSRKFWVLVAALLATTAAFVSQEITVWQALQMAVAALAVYSTGVAIEDNGYGSQK
jgi:hypothetical protein